MAITRQRRNMIEPARPGFVHIKDEPRAAIGAPAQPPRPASAPAAGTPSANAPSSSKTDLLKAKLMRQNKSLEQIHELATKLIAESNLSQTAIENLEKIVELANASKA